MSKKSCSTSASAPYVVEPSSAEVMASFAQHDAEERRRAAAKAERDRVRLIERGEIVTDCADHVYDALWCLPTERDEAASGAIVDEAWARFGRKLGHEGFQRAIGIALDRFDRERGRREAEAFDRAHKVAAERWLNDASYDRGLIVKEVRLLFPAMKDATIELALSVAANSVRANGVYVTAKQAEPAIHPDTRLLQ